MQEQEACDTLLARDYKDPKCIIEKNEIAVIDSYNKKLTDPNVSGCVVTRQGSNQGSMIMIRNKTQKGYLEANEGDGIDISTRMEHHRGTVQKDKSQTITTMGGENVGVVVKEVTNDVINPLKDKSKYGWHFEQNVYDDKGCTRTLKASEGSGNIPKVIVDDTNLKKVTENYIEWKEKGHLDVDCRAYFEDKVAPTTTTTPKGKVLQNNLRIRKLTPKECFRLMGLKDEDIELISNGQTNSALYHLAGDSIVTTCLMAIYSELLGINWEDKFNPKEWWNNDNNKE